MNKKVKGFSLAELLIALLIISLVLSAAIPTLTRKNAKSSEKIWRWANENNSIYAAVGGNQTVLIGAEQKAYNQEDGGHMPLDRIFADDEIRGIIPSLAAFNNRFTPDGDKLVLFKEAIRDGGNRDNLINSHISFFNINESGREATLNAVNYAGRIALDAHNLAFGIGTLQNSVALNTEVPNVGQFVGHNTAVGHYAAFSNSVGQYNTAIGEKALTLNKNTNFNTAVGYHSLYTLATNDMSNASGQNTSIGAYALQGMQSGTGNTAIGYLASGAPAKDGQPPIFYNGSGNTAIGAGACLYLEGNNNICIGRNAGAKDKLTSISNGFFLGSDSNGIPLMFGNMSAQTGGTDLTRTKNLNINADIFEVNTANSTTPAFIINTTEAKNNKFYFIVDGNLGGGPAITNGAVFSVSETGNGEILLDSHDNGINGGNARNIIMSNRLFFGFPSTKDANGYSKAIIAGADSQTGIQIYGAGIDLKGTVNANDMAQFKKEGTNTNVFSMLNSASQFDVFKILTSNEIPTIDAPASHKIQFFGDKNYISEKTWLVDGQLFLNSLEVDSKDVALNIDSLWKEVDKLKYPSSYSDIRLKDNISDSTAGLKEINALEVKNYTLKKDKEKTPHVGLIAQQLQKVFPNAVVKDDDGYLMIRQEDIFYAMVNSIKELFSKIQDLTAKITGLDKRLTELEKENAQLKKQNEEFEKRLLKLEKASK